MTNVVLRITVVCLFLLAIEYPAAAGGNAFFSGLIKQQQVWNEFVDKLYGLHKVLLKEHDDYYTFETIAGYGGVTNNLEYYREVQYFERQSGKMLSVVKWEQEYPFGIHMIDVFIYGDEGRLKREYSATYLPSRHTSPSETLIILHYYKDGLHSFREFDASNILIYEECASMEDRNVIFAFHYEDIPESLSDLAKEKQPAYRSCFSHTADSAEPYTDPLAEIYVQDQAQ